MQRMSFKETRRIKPHTHKWVYRSVPADKPLHNVEYKGSKRGKVIAGYACKCGARDYIDLLPLSKAKENA